MKGKKMLAADILSRVSEKEILKAAGAIIGSKKSPARARASRKNGKLGGRPRKTAKAA